MELTPEERQRIFEEEKIRLEARSKIEKAQNKQLLKAWRASRRKLSARRAILLSGLALALLMVVAWRVGLTLANHEPVAMVQQDEACVGTAPSDLDWKLICGKAVIAGEGDGDHRSS